MGFIANRTATMSESGWLAYSYLGASIVVYGSSYSRKVPTSGEFFLVYVTGRNGGIVPIKRRF